jgi:hypothetical protein
MFGSNSKVWVLGLFVAPGVLTWALFRNFMGPWIDGIGSDFNSACWSQSAHDTIRAGLPATIGVPSVLYFGPLPIPRSGYYTHHPPLLSLMLAGMFAVLGEKEWVDCCDLIFTSRRCAALGDNKDVHLRPDVFSSS